MNRKDQRIQNNSQDRYKKTKEAEELNPDDFESNNQKSESLQEDITDELNPDDFDQN
ncbi:hypothetical protein [Aquisalibacillus elongatus]|uniref:Uncharacterized protein n=1 Tax=Aquisalibacillus elongatus TaxID=485577 RepID=A0A3N5B6Z7_9BACI|nr:hypothetical protein [Aquisalibacillus elongatus]RPF53466.1 hypothetical protein EDC24_1968 [Aquisalibacillus elongatus]